MIVFTKILLSSSHIKKGIKSFIHFKFDAKIPENISHYISYSLGHDIRPSILIKAPKGQKYLQRKAARVGLRGHKTSKDAFGRGCVRSADVSSKQYSS